MRRQLPQSGKGTCSASCLSLRHPHGSSSNRRKAAACGSLASPPGASRLTDAAVGGIPGGSRAGIERQPVNETNETKAKRRARSVLECNLAHANLLLVGDTEPELARDADVGRLPAGFG